MSDNNGDKASSNDEREESPLSRTIGSLFRVVGIGREEVTNWRDALKEVAAGADPAEYSFIASDAPARFREVGRRFLGDIVQAVERVDVEGYGRAA